MGTAPPCSLLPARGPQAALRDDIRPWERRVKAVGPPGMAGPHGEAPQVDLQARLDQTC